MVYTCIHTKYHADVLPHASYMMAAGHLTVHALNEDKSNFYASLITKNIHVFYMGRAGTDMSTVSLKCIHGIYTIQRK